MGTSQALLAAERAARPTSIQLLVTWRNPQTRRYHAVGLLWRTRDAYHFRYLDSAGKLDGFRPFLGFSSLGREYVAPHLFAIFAERVLDEARPDRLSLFDALDLGADAEPMEFLARSGGRRAGDTIELLQTPAISDSGHTSCVFLVHGIRYSDGASDAIEHLSTGQELRLLSEPENPADPGAILVTDDGIRLGWVPSPLLDYVHAVMDAGQSRLTVVRANSPEVGHHMRLLVRLEGSVLESYSPAW